MTRKFSEEVTAFERALLDAGRSEEPSVDLERRMLLPLGVVPLATAASLANGASRPAWAKWAVLGAVAATGAGLWAVSLGSATESKPSSSAVELPTAPDAIGRPPAITQAFVEASPGAVTRPASVPENPVNLPGEEGRRSATAPRGRRASVAKVGDTLREELALLERARAHLGRGDRDRALEVLARYHRRYQNGQLREEALVLEQKAKR